jgi:hypothetical protein
MGARCVIGVMASFMDPRAVDTLCLGKLVAEVRLLIILMTDGGCVLDLVLMGEMDVG